MNTNIGMAGEFRCVVKKADGSIKTDTGYQKNLILDQGLDFFGGGNGLDMMAYCIIGSGNSQPNYTQNKLDTAVLGVSGTEYSTKYDYNASTDVNLYKTNRVCKYSFTGLKNVNIIELGLASTYNSTTSYFLCTRALIKDSQGVPTTITVLSGEILEIYYKLWAVYDTTDKTSQINVLDGVGGSATYNCLKRLTGVGSVAFYSNNSGTRNSLGIILKENYNGGDNFITTTQELSANTSTSESSVLQGLTQAQQSVYTNGSYKKTLTLSYAVSQSNGNIRKLWIATSMGTYQIRFGSVANDSPIVKTNTQTLTIPVEVSWGRYEGAL